MLKSKKKIKRTKNLHMIIIDQNMDLMNGDVCTKRIKELVSRSYQDVYIIGHSSDDSK